MKKHMNPEEEQWKDYLEGIMKDETTHELNQRMDASFDTFQRNLSNHPRFRSTNFRLAQ